MALPTSRHEAAALDATDPLASLRDEFVLPAGVIYLDGNSLGPLSRATRARLSRVVDTEWGEGLIRSWNVHGWIDLAARVAASIAPLVGAGPDEVAVADSTSVNLFKLLTAALKLRPGRRTILSEVGNFPSDLYVAQGIAAWLADRVDFRAVPRQHLLPSLSGETAVLMLTHVDFRTGEILDMDALTAAAHECGALSLWDLSHSAGAVPVDLDSCGVDLAAGCGYKFLNGGPGAPAWAFVSRRHQPALEQPLWGWLGHEAPFAFDAIYRPAPGVGRLVCGTPPILSLSALEEGVALVARAGIGALREKSIGLTRLFIDLVDRDAAGLGLSLASPRETSRRGSQVSYRHPEGYGIIQALAEEGVIGDFREPDILRFGFGAAYLGYADVWDAAEKLVAVMRSGRFRSPEMRRRAKVT